ncbi:hypothetical protein L1787_16420 [Acuticoccus sp. M5D2P5]|uniref:hypothetical protein n=1 Tax=Acuticoccus kalidii TaxID=2910977 RepID=UPI001F2C6D09|nr:hypothetical protein [Acuticoccus kalidii]MCF3934991.1 hypothetical protein [Acuticoccus kalidii]
MRPVMDAEYYIYEAGLTHQGTRLLSPEELNASLHFIRKQNAFVKSMIAYEAINGKHSPNLNLSILDSSELLEEGNWLELQRSFAEVSKRIKQAQNAEHSISFRVWLGGYPYC